ncbi:tRNA guanosine(34) transglycosylase Tgt [Planctomycetes bacterium Pan216]|uniref:tRNA guanosine(34) transglycosylase Tgt n=1 Tax=Kolteria novifilia TaxID=2527975 RepID=UPI0011A70800
MSLTFELLAEDTQTEARLGRLTLPHGVVETPVFMPVGTQASVKGLLPEQVEAAGASIILGNTYHLALRPGEDRVAQLGGLHRFMNWERPILTDSGGYQVFSLEDLRQLDDDGVRFRSHIDGRWLELTPETAVAIQEKLGADIIMCFDECPPSQAPKEQVLAAVERTTRWARRCRDALTSEDQSLFGIVQGGIDEELRQQSAEQLVELDFPGYAIGGLSVGEPSEVMLEVAAKTARHLPRTKPRYLMGVGRPLELLEAVAGGVDMFDCVMPTRNGRNATAFTTQGRLKLRNACYAEDERPLDPEWPAPYVGHFSRAYIRHLFMAGEMLGPIIVSLHNIAFYCRWMREIRERLRDGRFNEYRASALARFGDSL